MNANEFTFGVEIETIAPVNSGATSGLRIGSYHHGVQVPYLPAGWTAESDGSIHSDRPGLACEIVSPVLKGEEGLNQVVAVLNILAAEGHRVNVTCGVHVHVGWNPTWSAVSLARLVTIVAYCEKGLYAITGTKARERGMYCGGVRKYGNKKNAKDRIDCDRYHVLNLVPLARGIRNAVEFRCFSGSLDPVKVIGWILVCLGMVQRAVDGKRDSQWVPKPLTGGWKKDGDGASETERLIGFLAWGKCYARIHHGVEFGWIPGAVLQDAVKAEFRRLAKKYDSMP